MKTIKINFNDPQFKLDKSAVTIGNFDGLHIGHQSLIDELLVKSQKHNVPSVVLTFSPHPVEVLFPQRELKKMFETSDLEACLEKMGVDYLLIMEFTREFAAQPARIFLEEFLIKQLSPAALVVGYNFSFGVKREAGVDFLREWSKTCGVDLNVCSEFKKDGEVVSSSRIREFLSKGDLIKVYELLGRNFYLEGDVVHGDGRGAGIGIPTANISPMVNAMPENGVYATRTTLKGETYWSVTNIGSKPTFNSNESLISVETHIIDENIDLYGEKIKVEFVSRLRGEKKFINVDALIKQIKEDIDLCKQVLKNDEMGRSC